MSNTITLDVQNEVSELHDLSGKFLESGGTFELKATLYVQYAIQCGNLDLLRVLREAIVFVAIQKRLDTWLKTVAPITKKKLSDGAITYRKDKKRARKEGWVILNESALNVGFIDWKKEKTDKAPMTLIEALEALQARVESAMDIVEDREGGELNPFAAPLQSMFDSIEHAIEQVTRQHATPTNAEVVQELRKRATISG